MEEIAQNFSMVFPEMQFSFGIFKPLNTLDSCSSAMAVKSKMLKNLTMYFF